VCTDVGRREDLRRIERCVDDSVWAPARDCDSLEVGAGVCDARSGGAAVWSQAQVCWTPQGSAYPDKARIVRKATRCVVGKGSQTFWCHRILGHPGSRGGFPFGGTKQRKPRRSPRVPSRPGGALVRLLFKRVLGYGSSIDVVVHWWQLPALGAGRFVGVTPESDNQPGQLPR
jgi:hypothetical protein